MIKALKLQDRKQINQFNAVRSSFYFIVLRKECLGKLVKLFLRKKISKLARYWSFRCISYGTNNIT
jgi:hypothetical protein